MDNDKLSVDLIPRDVARQLHKMSLSDFQEFCVTAPKALFTENINNNRTLVSWLGYNADVIRYAIGLGANVNTTANGYNNYRKSHRFHTSLDFISTHNDIFDLIIASDTFDISLIEYSNMLHRERWWICYGGDSMTFNRIIRLTDAMMSKKPGFLYNGLTTYHNLSSTVINCIIDKLPGHVDEKFKISVEMCIYKNIIKYIPKVSNDTIRDYRLYENMFENVYSFDYMPNDKLSRIWHRIGVRLGDDLTLSNGENLIVLLHNNIMTKIYALNFKIDIMCKATTNILSKLTVDWSYVYDLISDDVKTKRYTHGICHYMVVFIMQKYGFNNYPDSCLFVCFMSLLGNLYKGAESTRFYKPAHELRRLANVFGMNSTTLKMISDVIPTQHDTVTTVELRDKKPIMKHNRGYYSDILLDIISDDVIPKFPDEINEIAIKIQAIDDITDSGKIFLSRIAQ